MNVAVVANPVSGARRHRLELRAMFRKLGAAGIRVEHCHTQGPGDACRLAAEAAERCHAVIAVGGDGTVRDVARGLSRTGVPLVVWPAGTENLVAKTFGYKASADSVYQALVAGPTLQLDLARGEDRGFLVVGGIGFDADVVRRLTKLRNGHITHLTYADPLWRTFWQHRFPHVHVVGDDLDWEGRGMIFLGNIWRYSLGLPVVRDAIWDDGWLDVLILPCRTRVDLIGHSIRALLWRHIEHPSVVYRRVRRVRISSDEEVPVQFDGDNAGFLPVEVEIDPLAVALRVPPRRHRK